MFATKRLTMLETINCKALGRRAVDKQNDSLILAYTNPLQQLRAKPGRNHLSWCLLSGRLLSLSHTVQSSVSLWKRDGSEKWRKSNQWPPFCFLPPSKKNLHFPKPLPTTSMSLCMSLVLQKLYKPTSFGQIAASSAPWFKTNFIGCLRGVSVIKISHNTLGFL